MRFRPCIDIHNGAVKQIVGGSLKDCLLYTSVLLVSIENKDLVTNFAAVAATFNNIGPGLSLVGPMANFGHFTDFTKYILMFDMLAGRLEIFPMMLLFCPAVWKRRRA